LQRVQALVGRGAGAANPPHRRFLGRCKAGATVCRLLETAELSAVDLQAGLADAVARILACRIKKVDELLTWR